MKSPCKLLMWLGPYLQQRLAGMLRLTYSNGFSGFAAKVFGMAAPAAAAAQAEDHGTGLVAGMLVDAGPTGEAVSGAVSNGLSTALAAATAGESLSTVAAAGTLLSTVGAGGIFVGGFVDGIKASGTLCGGAPSKCMGGASLVTFLLSVALVLTVFFPLTVPGVVGAPVFLPLIKQVVVHIMKHVCELVSKDDGILDLGKMAELFEGREFAALWAELADTTGKAGSALGKGALEGVVGPFKLLANDFNTALRTTLQRMWRVTSFTKVLKDASLHSQSISGDAPDTISAIKVERLRCIDVQYTDQSSSRVYHAQGLEYPVAGDARWYLPNLAGNDWEDSGLSSMYLQEVPADAEVTVIDAKFSRDGHGGWKTEPPACALPEGTIVDVHSQGLEHRGIMHDLWQGNFIPDSSPEDFDTAAGPGDDDNDGAPEEEEGVWFALDPEDVDFWLVCRREDYCCNQACGCCFD